MSDGGEALILQTHPDNPPDSPSRNKQSANKKQGHRPIPKLTLAHYILTVLGSKLTKL